MISRKAYKEIFLSGNMDENKKILYLYTGDHPIHHKFAEAIGADRRKVSWDIPKGYDIYFSEGEFFKLIILRMIGKLNKTSKIINLFSDPRLYYLDKKIRFDVGKNKIMKKSGLKTFIFKYLMKKLDGAICVGQFQEKLLKKYYSGPIEKVDIFIDKNFHKRLLKMKHKLLEKKIFIIAIGPDFYYKGVDLLIKIANKNRDIDFTICGKSYDNFIRDNDIPENVKFVGKLTSLEIYNVFRNNSLYVHLGRGEAFGITIIEAMAAGLPCIVSDITGAKEAVEKVNPKFVLPLDGKLITEKIREYFDMSLKEKQEISKRFKEESKFYNEERHLKNFKKQFFELSDKLL